MRTTMLLRVFLTMLAGAAAGLEILIRNDRADVGRACSSWPAVLSLASSSALTVFRRRFLRLITCSDGSTEDVLRFLSTRDPSIGSSSSTSWLKTEWESGFVFFWGGRRSLASFGADDRRVVGCVVVVSVPFTCVSS